jgi:membrane associated rhomboid family serine protease
MAESSKKISPAMTYLLLSLMALIQFYSSTLPEHDVVKIYSEYALFPFKLFNGSGYAGILGYMFLHGSWIHLFVNAVALLGAGGIVEREIGSTRYILVYLSSGVIAGLAHSFLNFSSEVPLVGASGAIFGVIAVLFLLMPFKITFALIIPLPSVLVGIMLSAVEFSAFWISANTGVAHDAHLSGFIFGCLCAFAIDRKRALKGVAIAIIMFTVLYFLGIYFGLV